MKFELTKDQLIEIVECVSICELSTDDAIKYAIGVAWDMQTSKKTEVVWPDDDKRIDIVGTNGNDGLHYDKIAGTGLYD